jgi:hypothetical protein
LSAGPAEQLLRISLELAAGARARANMIPFNIKTYQCPQGTFKRGGCFPGSEMLGRLGGSTACPCRGRPEKGRKPVQEHQDEQADGRKPRVNQKTHLMLWGPPAGATIRCLETTPFRLSTFQYVFSTPVWPLSHLRALQAASCRDAPHRSLKKLCS